MYFEVTLSNHCPSLAKTTQPYAITPQSRVPNLYPVTFLRCNITSFMLHPPPHIPTYSLYHTSPREAFLLQGSPTSSSSLHHISLAPTFPHPTMVTANSLVCPSPARRTVLIADRSLQPLLWLPWAGKSSGAQLNASDHRITESQNGRGWKGPLWVI